MRRAASFIVPAAVLAFVAHELRAEPVSVPKVWDDQALSGWLVALAEPGHEPILLRAEQFYRMPELRIYKNYPVYASGREPVGYREKRALGGQHGLWGEHDVANAPSGRGRSTGANQRRPHGAQVGVEVQQQRA
jgi:hypothetical protein